MKLLRIATRGSTLALWQASHVASVLQTHHRGLSVDLDVVHTTGDRITDVPLAMIGDRGLFTKEVDAAVLDGRADLAVHSLKDVPTVIPDGLRVAAVMEREDPRDVYVPGPLTSPHIADIPAGARIGTSSLRRRSLLMAERGDIVVADLRGNLDTRLRRLLAGEYHGIVLALAGLRRIGQEALGGELLEPPHWLPAAGQGALAVVSREDDTDSFDLLAALDHPPTRAATEAERSFLRELEGGCQIPIGALADVRETGLQLHGLVASLDGTTIMRGEVTGQVSDAAATGVTLARQLLDSGAGTILDAIRNAPPVTGAPAP